MDKEKQSMNLGWNKIYHEKSADTIVPWKSKLHGKGWTIGDEVDENYWEHDWMQKTE